MTSNDVAAPDDVDLWDVGMFAQDDGLAALARFRDLGGPVWHDRSGGEAFWAVTHAEHARTVLRQPLVFSSATANGGMMLRPTAFRAMETPAGFGGPMIEVDPPLHAGQRQVLAPTLSRRSVAGFEAMVRSVAIPILEEATDLGEFDFTMQVAHRIPAAVTLSMMGVPTADWDRLAEVQHRCLAAVTPAELAAGKAVSGADSDAALVEVATYFFGLLSEKADRDDDDLLGMLLRGLVNGEPRSLVDVLPEAVLLLNGGLDTTRAAGSAGGMLGLLRHPDQLARLRVDPSGIGVAVEEFVRWASPIRHVARTAMADVELGGAAIREGDRIGVWLGACNRDPAAFADPDRYDTARVANPHLGFAFGEHFCLGIHLARLILRVTFDEVLARWSNIELTGEPQGVCSNFVGGVSSLPVRVTPA